jgi:hypothetical protein
MPLDRAHEAVALSASDGAVKVVFAPNGPPA